MESAPEDRGRSCPDTLTVFGGRMDLPGRPWKLTGRGITSSIPATLLIRKAAVHERDWVVRRYINRPIQGTWLPKGGHPKKKEFKREA